MLSRGTAKIFRSANRKQIRESSEDQIRKYKQENFNKGHFQTTSQRYDFLSIAEHSQKEIMKCVPLKSNFLVNKGPVYVKEQASV